MNQRTFRGTLSETWPAVLAGIVALAAAVVWRTVAGTRIFAEIALEAMIDVLPGQDFSSLLGAFGPYGKALFFVSVLAGQLVVFAAAWLVARGLLPYLTSRLQAAVAGLGAAAAFLATTVVLIAATNASLGDTGSFSYLIATFGYCGVYAVVAHFQSTGDSNVEESRRQLLVRVPGIVLGGLAVLVLGRTLRETAGGGAQVSRPGEPTPEITANEDFYKVSKNLFDTLVDGDSWSLKVTGLVEQDVELRYADIVAMPFREQYTTLQCISNPVAGDLISNAHWRGVPMKAVLDAAGVLPEARFVLIRCADDYTETLPIDFVQPEQVMLAYEMNGVPLPADHGFPLRLLAPGKYGVKHTKWITEITLIQEEEFGYWQRQGWDQEARMNTTVRLDVPGDDAEIVGGPVLIQGIAFAGDRGISRVEVSTDAGETWSDADLKTPLSPYTWVLWQYEWRNPDRGGTGRRLLVARAWDGGGELQPDDMPQPYPDGATKFHRVPVEVEEEA